jgi:uncharacterized membrane protein YgcG
VTHSVGLWVVLAIVAFSCLWFLVIRAYARRHGADIGLRGVTSYGSRDVMYNPDPGSSQRGPDIGQRGRHDGGGGSGGPAHHGSGWPGGGGDSGGGSHHH